MLSTKVYQKQFNLYSGLGETYEALKLPNMARKFQYKADLIRAYVSVYFGVFVRTTVGDAKFISTNATPDYLETSDRSAYSNRTVSERRQSRRELQHLTRSKWIYRVCDKPRCQDKAERSNNNMPKFKVGDRVENGVGLKATVKSVSSNGLYTIVYDNDPGVEYSAFTEEELTLASPTFKRGDRVVTPAGYHGTVFYSKPMYKISLDKEVPTHASRWYDEGELTNETERLSEEDAWILVATMLGKEVGGVTLSYIWESDRSELRHKAYVILGGNGVEVGKKGTPKHEAVKAKLNHMIDLATTLE